MPTYCYNRLTLPMASLAEIQNGVITASMPSFARMLHHHRLYWSPVRARLSFHRHVSHTQTSQHPASTLASETRPKAEKARFGRVKNWFDSLRSFNGSEGITTEGGGLKSIPRINTDDLSIFQNYVKGEYRDSVHMDSVLPTHDVEHIWTPINPGTSHNGL